MDGANREIEIKLRFDSPAAVRERLRGLGAVERSPRTFEDNVLFDRDDDPLAARDEMLRLRLRGDAALLTYKGPAEAAGRYKERPEEETHVEDPASLARILGRIGFRPFVRYQKFRTSFRLASSALAICLDETPIGCFVELEGEPAEIDRVAALLGAGPQRYIRESYMELYAEHVAARGEPFGDMTFAEEDRTPR